MLFRSNQIDIVLVETSHPGNIGSVARAMKTMGLKNLILVNPKEFPSKEAFMLSGNAQDVIEEAIVVNTLEEAINESTNIYATSARTRTISWPIITADEAGIEINKNVNKDSTNLIEISRKHYKKKEIYKMLSNQYLTFLISDLR